MPTQTARTCWSGRGVTKRRSRMAKAEPLLSPGTSRQRRPNRRRQPLRPQQRRPRRRPGRRSWRWTAPSSPSPSTARPRCGSRTGEPKPGVAALRIPHAARSCRAVGRRLPWCYQRFALGSGASQGPWHLGSALTCAPSCLLCSWGASLLTGTSSTSTCAPSCTRAPSAWCGAPLTDGRASRWPSRRTSGRRSTRWRDTR